MYVDARLTSSRSEGKTEDEAGGAEGQQSEHPAAVDTGDGRRSRRDSYTGVGEVADGGARCDVEGGCEPKFHTEKQTEKETKYDG